MYDDALKIDPKYAEAYYNKGLSQYLEIGIISYHIVKVDMKKLFSFMMMRSKYILNMLMLIIIKVDL